MLRVGAAKTQKAEKTYRPQETESYKSHRTLSEVMKAANTCWVR